MGFINVKINNRARYIKTVELKNLIPCNTHEVITLSANKKTINKIYDQNYSTGVSYQPLLLAGDALSKINYGYCNTHYGSADNKDFPNLTYNDFSQTTIKFNVNEGTNLVELLENYNIGESLRIFLNENDYLDINVVDASNPPNYPNRIGFSLNGVSNGISIYMKSGYNNLTSFISSLRGVNSCRT